MKKRKEKDARLCGEPVEVRDSDNCPDLDKHDYFESDLVPGTNKLKHMQTVAEALMLPWVTGDSTPDDEEGDNALNIYDEDSGGNLIAECINPETADYIVRAVNAHEAMLEALKEAEKIIRVARQYFPKSTRNSDKFSLENTCAAIGSAIHKAEGRS